MKPTVGRTVHFQPRGRRDGAKGIPPQAAIIVELEESAGLGPGSCEENLVGVHLAVLTRSCVTFPGSVVRYHPDGAPGTWCWPPREKPSAQLTINADANVVR
jgi:hypothetical protein